jgi:hypothetical protein
MPDVYQDDKPTQYNTSHTFFDPKKNLNKKLPFKYHSETEVKINKLYKLSKKNFFFFLLKKILI